MLPSWDKIDYNFKHYSEPKYVFRNEYGNYSVEDSHIDFDQGTSKDLVSEDRKIILPIQTAYFHVITEIIPIIIQELKQAEQGGYKIHIVLTMTGAEQEFSSSHINSIYEHIVKLLESGGHKTSRLPFDRRNPCRINNFVIYENYTTNLSVAKDISKFLLNGLVDLDSITPFRKVYLSRSKTLSNSVFRATDEEYANLTLAEIREKYKYKTNDRLDDEALVEEYFRELGFEIFSPEDIDSFEYQLRFVAETRTLASITSAGLTTMLAMKPGGVVVELSTPLTTPAPDQQTMTRIHPHYYHLAHELRHTYISISHDKKASEIIGQIENNTELKKFLMS